jgi:hypothetical protein
MSSGGTLPSPMVCGERPARLVSAKSCRLRPPLQRGVTGEQLAVRWEPDAEARTPRARRGHEEETAH